MVSALDRVFDLLEREFRVKRQPLGLISSGFCLLSTDLVLNDGRRTIYGVRMTASRLDSTIRPDFNGTAGLYSPSIALPHLPITSNHTMPVVVTSLSLHSIPTLLILIALAAAARPLISYILFRLNRAPYPPGPKPRWLVGNLFDIPTKNIPQVFASWAKKYNSMQSD